MVFSALFLALTASAVCAAPIRLDARATQAGDFHLQNGLDAQKLNAQFQTLTADSQCSEGQQACIGDSFAQCVAGAFQLSPCSGGTTCVALPLVNKAGTSITCDTTSDAEDRIAQTGATGGLDGSGGSASQPASADSSDGTAAPATVDAPAPTSTADVQAAAPASTTAAADFHLQNGLDAQKLNAQFQTLTADSQCSEGQQACIGDSFAQCVAGAFQLSPCSGGTTCVALPLVNKAGTSITCDTTSDAEDRIAQTGATGGLDGSGGSASQPASSDSSDGTAAPATVDVPATPASTTAAVQAAAPTSTSAATGFQAQNALDAQKLNAQFQTLTADSQCSEGQQACIGDSFAQCVSGAFQLSPCSGGTTCVALPLVNKPGTSITCDTLADAEARIAATGVTGGIAGSS